ncbi:MAG: hypothetical protein HKN72_17485 [Gemmatimonadetes bacterium]|nr:hypothetical protein [Gemmatimonadota bacterium]
MKWVRLVATGMAWAVVYNGLWLLAWITFMRREWTEAAGASGESMPWTLEFWAVWIPVTVAFGFAVGGHLLSRPADDDTRRAAWAASLVIWVPGTIGMAFVPGLTPRIMVLDGVVNLVAVLVASLVVTGGMGRLLGPDASENTP